MIIVPISATRGGTCDSSIQANSACYENYHETRHKGQRRMKRSNAVFTYIKLNRHRAWNDGIPRTDILPSKFATTCTMLWLQFSYEPWWFLLSIVSSHRPWWVQLRPLRGCKFWGVTCSAGSEKWRIAVIDWKVNLIRRPADYCCLITKVGGRGERTLGVFYRRFVFRGSCWIQRRRVVGKIHLFKYC